MPKPSNQLVGQLKNDYVAFLETYFEFSTVKLENKHGNNLEYHQR